MRIGILSLNPGHNYGGILQSFALQNVLENLGHHVSIICKNVYEQEPDLLHSYRYVSRILRMIIHRSSWEATVIPERVHNRIPKTNRQNTDRFMMEYLHRKMYDSFVDIKESDYDCIIVGSDQVWRPIYFEGQYNQSVENAFLSFTKGWNIKRIAYAASFGTDEWEYNAYQTAICAELLRAFDAVSVREDSGVALCRKYFSVDACNVIDPTLLLTAEDYLNNIDLSKTSKSKGNLLVYVLDWSEELDRLIEKVAKEKSLVPFETGIKYNHVNPLYNVYPPVESWIQGFNDAEFVITDSFHACVFSLIFHKPFIVVGNKRRGLARFTSFLSRFKLEKSMIYDVKDDINWDTVDFSYADNVLNSFRNQALNFLKSI